MVVFWAFFWRFFTNAGLHIEIPLVNINLKDTLFTDLEYLWKIVDFDRIFIKNPLFVSLNCIERSEAALSLKNKLKNHPQPCSC